jgi:arylsulfatase A-like enzyme
MTGLYPHTHGVPRNGFVLSPDNLMLAEILKRNGFRTAAFLGSFTLDRRFGFDRGFDEFNAEFDTVADMRTHDQDQRRAASVTDAALRWIDAARREPTFLFVHYFDAHAPYEPPPPFDRSYTRADGPKAAGPAEIDPAVREHQKHAIGAELGQERVIQDGLTRDLATRDPGPATELDRDLEALYDGEISYVDRELGRLLDGLAQRGWLEGSLVIVTSDHGETFAEHGDAWNHGLWVYETTVHVPLIVRRSDRIASREVATPVSNVDVLPTVLGLLGIQLPGVLAGGLAGALDGVDLSPALDGGAVSRGPVFSEATQPPAVEKGVAWKNERKPKCVRDGRWKYIRAPYLELDQLFDLETDPGERNNLLVLPESDTASAAAREIAPKLRSTLDGWSRSAHPRPSRFDPSQMQDTLQRLRGLGYPGDEDGAGGEPEKKH